MRRSTRRLRTIVIRMLVDLLPGCFAAWLVMLCVGAAHHTDPRIPPLGYFTTLWLVAAVTVVIRVAAPTDRPTS